MVYLYLGQQRVLHVHWLCAMKIYCKQQRVSFFQCGKKHEWLVTST